MPRRPYKVKLQIGDGKAAIWDVFASERKAMVMSCVLWALSTTSEFVAVNKNMVFKNGGAILQ